MGKALKMVGYGMAGLALLATVGLGVWVYVVQNVEKPAYKVAAQDGAFELRDYPALVVAEVTTQGDRKSAVNAGFRPLANYIFAKERTGAAIPMTAPVTQQRETIAMTAPVTQSRTGEAGTWTIRFIMPSKYTIDTLPKPAGSQVRLQQVPAMQRAALRFSGVASDELIAEQEPLLRAWVKARGLTAVEPPVYAYYNDPFTPGPLRRNEVILDLVK
jgi:hypothetical protein